MRRGWRWHFAGAESKMIEDYIDWREENRERHTKDRAEVYMVMDHDVEIVSEFVDMYCEKYGNMV